MIWSSWACQRHVTAPSNIIIFWLPCHKIWQNMTWSGYNDISEKSWSVFECWLTILINVFLGFDSSFNNFIGNSSNFYCLSKFQLDSQTFNDTLKKEKNILYFSCFTCQETMPLNRKVLRIWQDEISWIPEELSTSELTSSSIEPGLKDLLFNLRWKGSGEIIN